MHKNKLIQENRLFVEQALRCFMVSAKERATSAPKTKPEAVVNEEAKWLEVASRPFGGPCLIFDTETFQFKHGQRARFGAYQLRGISKVERLRLLVSESIDDFRAQLDRPCEWGLFYDPRINREELAELQAFCDRANRARNLDLVTGDAWPALKLMTVQAFIKNVLYACAKDHGADLLIIGHNLAFDIGALSTHASPSQDEFFFGGFTLKLCDCEVRKADGSPSDDKLKCIDHPPMQVKPIGAKKRMFGWRTEGLREGTTTKTVEITAHCLDTSQFARALLGPIDTRLENLTSEMMFDTRTKKSKFQAHDGPITAEYLTYCINDVQATFEVWDKLRARYREHGLTKGPWEIYSEASLGKGYYREFGVPHFMLQHKDFPPEIIGLHMQAYYGGRSEVRIRKGIYEVSHTDFKSQYPSVNALMGLQEMLLAERIEIDRGEKHLAKVRAFLDGITLKDLQKPQTWRHPLMRTIVRIVPSGDILPVRTEYEPGGDATNIGVNIVESGLPVWHTLADAIASKLLTGRAPAIDDAVTLIPIGRVKTKPFKLFGRDDYCIDLEKDDLFTRLIDLRIEAQEKAKSATNEAERSKYAIIEKALKLIANATSYGVLTEFNVDRRTGDYRYFINGDGKKRRSGKRGFPVDVYCGDRKPKHLRATRLEEPGEYFAGPIGAHITGGGRLLLAIAEQLGRDRGLDYVFCDTDSMCFARPEGMPRADFQKAVREIVAWFEPLYPYKKAETASLLQIEDVNLPTNTDSGEFEPLYALAISAKRYALFNLAPFETTFGRARRKGEPASYPLLRKMSAHGTGQLTEPDGYVPITPKPPMEKGLRPGKDGKLTGKSLGNRAAADQLLADVWRQAIIATVAGHEIDVRHAQLDVPIISNVTLGSKGMWDRFKHLPDRRPFMFFSVMPRLKDVGVGEEIEGLKQVKATTFYGPRSRDYADIKDHLRRSDNNQPFAIEEWGRRVSHETLNDFFEGYFDRNEWKSHPEDGTGLLERRRLIIVAHITIGKESDAVKDEENEEAEGEFGDDTKPDPALQRAALFYPEILRGVSLVSLSQETALTQDQLSDWRAGRSAPDAGQRRRLIEVLDLWT